MHTLPPKKTKIVCTVGPATESQESLEKLLKAGMNVMRLNFSHGDFEEHGRRIHNLRAAMIETGIPAAVLQDLGGPKIRIGTFTTEVVTLKEGQTFTLTTREIVGDENIVHVNYPLLPKEVEKGHHIFLFDGRLKLEVLKIKDADITCKVLVGGEIKGKRGVNLPHSNISISSLTPKDKKDLAFGFEHNVDYVALSFVRKPSDITELRKILDKKKSQAGIIAKIETPQAVANIDEIIKLSDGIMVARGDLAIEIPAEHVPMVQKAIIKKCNEAGKPVITATQMLESMIKTSIPTRAEVSDIANAIIDGTDAIMLSEETTLGKYPVEAVSVMSRVAHRVETDFLHKQLLGTGDAVEPRTVGEAINASAVRTAERVKARLIVSLTHSGYSARMISRHKPTHPILVMTPHQKTFNKALLYFAAYPVLIKQFKTLSEVLVVIRKFCLENNLAQKGDKVVVACGMPFGKVIETNMMLVETI
ncbi:MAG: pyruvate kinase [Candidatus Paceibacterota bacterium]|jgi:pyruvate kinase